VNPLVAALIALAALTLVKATPLIFAALGGVLSERSGVVNIGLEGIMIGGAFTAVCVSGATGSPLLGAIAGIIAGAALAALLAFVATRLAYDQIVAGTGLNIVALGGAAFGLVLVFGQPGASHEVPAFGQTGEAVLTVLALVLAGALSLFLTRTPPRPPGSIRCARGSGRLSRAVRSPHSAACISRSPNSTCIPTA
jgi:simple sugar transport system permease protein